MVHLPHKTDVDLVDKVNLLVAHGDWLVFSP